MKSKKNILCKILVFISAIVLCVSIVPNKIKADEPTVIMTSEDLMKIYSNPAGSYVLGADIDMTGQTWKPVDFTGTFEGNNYAILNLSINQLGDSTDKTYDGNMIDYDTYFSGFFGTLRGATVSNLKILGANIDVNTEKACFIGGIAGFMDNSHIIGCEMQGQVKLTTTGPSFGVGGIAGFGNGSIEGSSADVTLICIDQDVEQKDEQFMGGAYCAGYIDVKDTTIHIQGFDSDHGYVHNGGLVGMYILYPAGTEHEGYFLNNHISGFIQFFEDNEDRRAYCDTYIGEIMNWTFDYDDAFHTGVHDDDEFERDEIFDYDHDLMPCKCGNNAYVDTVVESTETTNGYIEHKCSDCGYYSRDNYKVIVGNPQPIIVEEETTVEEKPQKSNKKGIAIVAIICAVILAGVIVIFILLARKKLNDERKRKRRQRRR